MAKKASGELVKIGAAAVPLLHAASRDTDNAELAKRAKECLDAIHNSGLLAACVRLLAERNPEGTAEALFEFLPFADDEGLAGWLVWTAFDFSTDVTCLPPACPSTDNGEHHFGLWHADYTPKPAVEMLRAFTAR